MTVKVKKALEKALTIDLKADSVTYLGATDVGDGDSGSSASGGGAGAAALSTDHRTLQSGNNKKFKAQLIAMYRNDDDGVYGTRVVSVGASALAQSVMNRMKAEFGTVDAPLDIASVSVEGTGIVRTSAPTVSPGPSVDMALIGGVAAALVLFGAVVVMIVIRSRGVSPYTSKRPHLSLDKSGGRTEPQDDDGDGGVFGRQLVEAMANKKGSGGGGVNRGGARTVDTDWRDFEKGEVSVVHVVVCLCLCVCLGVCFFLAN
jgi:hypothetical protein